MNTYNWIISAVECKVKDGDLNDVIFIAHWRFNAKDENGISAEIYGAESFEAPKEDDFTPFDDITTEQVIGWLETSMDVDAMKLNLDNQINLLVNPEVVTLQLKK